MNFFNDKIDELNIARGIGIYLVVLGHALDHYNRNYIPLGSLMEVKEDIYFFHMPLFFFIAGLVYTRSSKYALSLRSYSDFISRKVNRILIPYLSFSILLLLLRDGVALVALMKGDFHFQKISHDIALVIMNPHKGLSPYLWFLHTLFIIFCISPIIDMISYRVNLFQSTWIMVVLFSYVLSFQIRYNLFADLFGNYIFFYLGYVFSKNVEYNKNILNRFGSASLLIFISLIIFKKSILSDITLVNILYLFSVALSGILSITYLSLRAKEIFKEKCTNLLNELGKSSYDIYLLHYILGIYLFGICYYKVIGSRLDPNIERLFISVVLPVVTIYLSMLMTKYLLDRYPITRKYLLGKLN